MWVKGVEPCGKLFANWMRRRTGREKGRWEVKAARRAGEAVGVSWRVMVGGGCDVILG